MQKTITCEEAGEREFLIYLLIHSYKQVVQGLQAFTFCVVTVNVKRTEPRFKRKRRG